MGEGGLERNRKAGEGMEQAVRRDVTPQFPDVPSQFADDLGGLVGKGDRPARRHGFDISPGTRCRIIEGRRCGIISPNNRNAGDGTIGEIPRRGPQVELFGKPLFPKGGHDPVKGRGIRRNKGDLDPRRIPAPDLQAVEAVQQEVHFPVFRQGLRRHAGDASGAGQTDDFFDVLQDIPVEPPDEIADHDEAVVHGLQIGRRNPSRLLFQQFFFNLKECFHSPGKKEQVV